MYCGSTKVLDAVDIATGYSEFCTVKNRCLNTITNVLSKMWLLRHDAPKSFKGDQEFSRPSLQKWLEHRGIEFRPVSSRRNNKTGIVERKNRVIKGALEILENDARHEKLHDNQRMGMAQFTSNMLYR